MTTKPPIAPMTIIVDTREQLGFDFAGLANDVELTVIRARLNEGDYALCVPDITPFDQRIVIERKSIGDLFSSLTHGRGRFEMEAARLSGYGYAGLVVESDLAAIQTPDLEYPTMTNPRSILASLSAWSLRFGLHIWPCPTRSFAEYQTFDLLWRWHIRHQPAPKVRRRPKAGSWGRS